MRNFFSTLPRNLALCFAGRWIIAHLLAIGLTVLLVSTDSDWRYFHATRNPDLFSCAFPAATIGMLFPLALPLLLFLVGILSHDARAVMAGWAIGQAELIGSLISSSYKAVTGRPHPPLGMGADMARALSHEFRFGLFRGGIFWGWPSSHTTVAFAMAFTVFTLYPRQRCLGFCAILYAVYIGLGVSMTIHWLSDFVAGMIIGTVVGIVVGKSFSSPPAI